MIKLISHLEELKSNIESAAFLVSRGASEKETHKALVRSLVLIEQIETEIKGLSKADDAESVVLPSRNININSEIKKVHRRAARWFNNPSQYNSTILLAYLRLAERHSEVTPAMVKAECSAVKDFEGNYNQMKNFGEKNHGKVFEEKGGVIRLWEPVKDYIMGLYSEYKKGSAI